MHIPQEIADTVADPAAYSDRTRADEAFTWLRSHAPLAQIQPEGYDQFWAVVRHADLMEVERRGDVFVNSRRSPTLIDIPSERRVRELTGGSSSFLKTMLDMDAPEHMKFRKLTQSRFMPQNLKKLEIKVREMVRGYIARMDEMGGKCDFARDVAFLFPLHVIMELLGVPEADEPLMLRLTQELFGNMDPEVARNRTEENYKADMDIASAVINDIMNYFNDMTQDRRTTPRDDLASLIANGTVDGELLGPLETGSYYLITATAGHDTTSSSLAGSMLALAQHPELLGRLQAEPEKIGSFIDESIRWITPVKHFMRTAARDTELAGRKIAEGDWLLLSYASANRDELVFEDPTAFNMDRPPNRHVAFGYGAHNCLGQHLARMEMRIFWEEMLPRLKSVALDGPTTWTSSNFVSGPKAMPISYEFN